MIQIIPRYYEEQERINQDKELTEMLELHIKLLRTQLDFQSDIRRYEENLRSDNST